MLHATSRSKPLIRTNFYLSEAQRETLFSKAAVMDISGAELLRRIVDKGLKQVK